MTRELVACLVVMLGVELARLIAMVLRMEVVGPGDMRVVGSPLVTPGGMRLGGGVMVPGGVLVMRGRVLVMLDLLLVGHGFYC